MSVRAGRWVNHFLMGLLSCPAWRLMPPDLAVLSYVGPKSGLRISLPVEAERIDGRWLVTVGRPEEKTWHHAFRVGQRAELLQTGVVHKVYGQLGTDAGLTVVRFDPLS